jgi:Kef-type K+ transport system membrane component KefB
MADLKVLLADMAWPMTILIAWLAGEYAHQRAKLPRISIYALIGFVLAPSQTGFLPQTQSPALLLLANISFGLILFECGYRINLRWLRANPWITVTGFIEAVLTFTAVYLILTWYDQPTSTSLLIAALSMATSPATIVRVINEQRSSGQVTERVLHLSALNCVMAVFVFKVIVGLEIFRTSGNLWDAMNSSFVVLAASVMLGVTFGVLISGLLRFTKSTTHDSTLAFTIAVVCLVVLAHGLKLSPILAALTLGLSTRHRRISLSSSQRGFGTLGDLLSILLFVFIASRIEWQQVVNGIGLGIAIIACRLIAKIVGIVLIAHTSGVSWRKGLLIGMAMTPISAFVILVLEQTRYLGIDLVDQLAPLATAALTLELLGPIFVQRAVILAGETIEATGS